MLTSIRTPLNAYTPQGANLSEKWTHQAVSRRNRPGVIRGNSPKNGQKPGYKMKYRVSWEETRKRVMEVEAESEDEAYDKARDEDGFDDSDPAECLGYTLEITPMETEN